MKVYLASPFFNDEEIEIVNAVEQVLESKGIDVFSPRKNQFEEMEHGSPEWARQIYRNDVNHVISTDATFAITNGNYMDAGTAFEIGYAIANNKPTFIFNSGKINELPNLMIMESLHAYFSSYDEIIKYDFDLKPLKLYEGDNKYI